MRIPPIPRESPSIFQIRRVAVENHYGVRQDRSAIMEGSNGLQVVAVRNACSKSCPQIAFAAWRIDTLSLTKMRQRRS